MDISSLALNPFSTMAIRHPITGKPDPDGGEIDIYGKDSSVYRNAQTEAFKKAAAAKEKESDNFDANAAAIAIYAECIKDWRNIKMGDDDIECTHENKLMILTDERFLWLQDQIEEHLTNRANFINPS